jgi:hypothetical protein
MKNLLKSAGGAVKRLGAAAVDLYKRYPSRGNSYILAGLVAAGSAIGVVVNPQSAGTIVAIVVPILLGGEATHHLVSPAK